MALILDEPQAVSTTTQTIQRGLDRLSDTLRISLRYDNGKVKGSDVGTYQVADLGLPMVVSCKSFFFKTHVGVLVHVHGDLYIMAAWYPPTGATIACLINDGAFNGMASLSIPQDSTLAQALSIVKPGLIKAFVWQSKMWHPLELDVLMKPA